MVTSGSALSDTYDCVRCIGKERSPIKITLRDGKVVDGKAWDTTPYQVAERIR